MGPYALAFLAGVISFTSPCCLPLMPGYVSYVTGVASETIKVATLRSRVVGAGVLFVVGFSIVFTALGAAASSLGGVLLQNRESLIRIGGVLVIVMGFATMGVLRIPLLYREARFDLHAVRPGPAGALPLGMAFAIGWTPCIGPVLAGILTAAASVTDAGRGAALLFAYSLGLGLPFLLLAMGLGRGGRLTAWLRRHGRSIEVAGGSLLVVMGILMITGAWLRLFTPILRIFSRSGWPPV
ncbi:MAG: cytochrome c biogenesis protein CcdA [Actinomycetota bacterium]|nr:cytochrome c biogenesis protein CcdA [Actinomycetota bacterium]